MRAQHACDCAAGTGNGGELRNARSLRRDTQAARQLLQYHSQSLQLTPGFLQRLSQYNSVRLTRDREVADVTFVASVVTSLRLAKLTARRRYVRQLRAAPRYR